MSDEQNVSRRDFLKVSSTAVVGVGLGSLLGGQFASAGTGTQIPASEGYLVVDPLKCMGCTTCMMTCSMVHHGESNLSLSRIQVVSSPFDRFPDHHFAPQQCRQCVDAACVNACPTGAATYDAAHGNVRVINEKKCIGCQRCVEACQFVDSRAIWNSKDKHAMKCDLCTTTPHWDQKGGPGGKQACVEMCPMKAIKFTNEVPKQDGDAGYRANLRKGTAWATIGMPVGDDGEWAPGQQKALPTVG